MPIYKVKVVEHISNEWFKTIEATSLDEAWAVAESLDLTFENEENNWELNIFKRDTYDAEIEVTEKI
jgi:hypothetical protein